MFNELHKGVLVGRDDRYIIVLEGVAIHEYLGDVVASLVDVFYLFRSDILAVAELVDVLFPIHYLQGAVGEDGSNVSTVHPPLRVEGLFRSNFVIIVSLEDGFTPQADLSDGRIAIRVIVHFRNVYKLELDGSVDSSHRPSVLFTAVRC